MGFKNGAYASIYTAKQNGKTFSCKILIGHTDKKTNEYTYDFTSFVNFAGKASEKVSSLGLPEDQDRNNPIKRRIKLNETDVTSRFNIEYYNKLLSLASGNEELTKFIKANADKKTYTVWDFDLAEDFENNSSATPASGKAKKPASASNAATLDEDDVQLPF